MTDKTLSSLLLSYYYRYDNFWATKIKYISYKDQDSIFTLNNAAHRHNSYSDRWHFTTYMTATFLQKRI